MLACCLLVAPTTLMRAALPADAQDGEIPTSYAAEPGLRDVVEAFDADYNSLRRFYPLAGSDRRAQRMRAFLERWSDQLEQMDYSSLDLPARIEFLLLRAYVKHELKVLYHDEAKLAEVRALVPFGDTLIALEEARSAMKPIDARAAATTLSDVNKQVVELRRRVEAAVGERQRRAGGGRGGFGGDEATTGPSTAPATGPIVLRPAAPDRPTRDGDEASDEPATAPATSGRGARGVSIDATQALRAAEQITRLGQALRRWNDHYAQFNPEFAWWNGDPYAKLSKSLEDYAKLLRERVAGVRGQDDDPLIGDPIGRQALFDDLEAEMIDYTPQELIAIAQRELAWCNVERIKASREMGFGDDWKAAVDKVKNDHVPPGKQDEMVLDLARQAIAFVDEHELVTIPELCRETWQLDMLDSRRQRILPFAAYGGQRMMVAYATADMDHQRKLESMRGNNVPFTRIVAAHELIPGHHLQGFMAQRYRPWRRMFSTPFYGEGWALHWEMLLWDMSFPRTPDERIGMLVWRSHRAARIIVSLSFHLGEMTPQQMVDFLVENVGLESDGATSEVRRFIGDEYSPLYQCGYMIGGLQIRAMYKELVENGRMTPRQFHDAVLQQNSIPIAMVRAGIVKLPLDEREPPQWKFAGEIEANEP